MVLTPSMIYDFAHDQMGSGHVKLFRQKCEQAADYVDAYIRGRLHSARAHLLMEGRWGGTPMRPGYMVDMRKTLSDGSPNENQKRFTPFEPYADVVNEYFRLFLHYGGNIRATYRHIEEHGPYLPDPAVTKAPPGFKIAYRFKHFSKGYYLTRHGLSGMLTNAEYTGHSVVRGQVVPLPPSASWFRRKTKHWR